MKESVMRKKRSFEQALCADVVRAAIVLVAAAMGAGCAADDPAGGAADDGSDLGMLRIPLQQATRDGAVYQLSGSFRIEDPDGSSIVVPSTGPRPIELVVAPGRYHVALLAGWSLAGSTDGGASFSPVSAVVSADTADVEVSINRTGEAALQFLVPSASGSRTLGMGADSHPRQLDGTLHVATAGGVLAGYAAGSTIQFATYYDDTAMTRAVTTVGKRIDLDTTATGTNFFDDPIGVLTARVAPKLLGAYLDWSVTVAPDRSEGVGISLFTQRGPGNVELSVPVTTLFQAVAAIDANGYANPEVQFWTTVPFQLSFDDGTAWGTMSGELQLRSLPTTD